MSWVDYSMGKFEGVGSTVVVDSVLWSIMVKPEGVGTTVVGDK